MKLATAPEGALFVEQIGRALDSYSTFRRMSLIRFLPALALALLGAPAFAHAQLPTSPPQPGDLARDLGSLFGPRSNLPAVRDTVASRAKQSTCPMLVARPDTTRLERMPRVRIDSSGMAPMPVLRGCVAAAR
jgi:hypothetical protein